MMVDVRSHPEGVARDYVALARKSIDRAPTRRSVNSRFAVRPNPENMLDAALVLDAASMASVKVTSRGGVVGTRVTGHSRRHS